MASNDREVKKRYEIELRVTEVTRTDVVNSYEKTTVSSTEKELEVELIAVRGTELGPMLERLKKNIDLVIEDHA